MKLMPPEQKNIHCFLSLIRTLKRRRRDSRELIPERAKAATPLCLNNFWEIENRSRSFALCCIPLRSEPIARSRLQPCRTGHSLPSSRGSQTSSLPTATLAQKTDSGSYFRLIPNSRS